MSLRHQPSGAQDLFLYVFLDITLRRTQETYSFSCIWRSNWVWPHGKQVSSILYCLQLSFFILLSAMWHPHLKEDNISNEFDLGTRKIVQIVAPTLQANIVFEHRTSSNICAPLVVAQK